MYITLFVAFSALLVACPRGQGRACNHRPGLSHGRHHNPHRHYLHSVVQEQQCPSRRREYRGQRGTGIFTAPQRPPHYIEGTTPANN